MITPAAQEPATLVCANGHPATPGARFCSQCGYSVRRPPRPANGPGLLKTIQGWSRRQRLIVAALIIGSALFVAQPFDSSSDTSKSSSRDTLIATDLPENECLTTAQRISFRSSSRETLPSDNMKYAPTYVSVGFAADVTDRCLVTVAQPDVGHAMQFLQTSDGSFRLVQATTISQIPVSAKQWNATGDRAGQLAAGSP